MSEEREIAEVEKELWQRVANDEGGKRANAYVALSRIAYDKGNFKDSLAMCETARDLFETEDVSVYRREIFDVNVGVSKNYEELGNFLEAARAMGKAIEAARVLEIESLDDLLRDQGRSWYRASEYENSIACHQEAMEFSELHLQEVTPGIDTFNIAMGLHELKRFPEAIEAYNKAREAFKEDRSQSNVVDCDYNLSDIYAKLKQSVGIEFHAQRALDYYETVGNHSKIWWLKYYLGIAKRLQSELDKASEYLDQAKNLAQAMGWQEWKFLVAVDKENAEILILRGHDDEAKEILRRVKSVEEILTSESFHEAA